MPVNGANNPWFPECWESEQCPRQMRLTLCLAHRQVLAEFGSLLCPAGYAQVRRWGGGRVGGGEAPMEPKPRRGTGTRNMRKAAWEERANPEQVVWAGQWAGRQTRQGTGAESGDSGHPMSRCLLGFAVFGNTPWPPGDVDQ